MLNDAPAPTGLDTSASALGDELPSQDFIVRFWGVRGSIPTPGSDTVRYGGNTACVEVSVAGQRIIFDGGTGLRVLGKHLIKEQTPIHAHLFFTHTHWDRIQGFPFFVPAFIDGNCFDIYGAIAANGASIKQCLTDQMLRPNFFTPLQKMSSEMQFHNITAGSVISLAQDITVETIALNTHTSALGFRVSHAGRSLVYATDSDTSGDTDPTLMYLAQSADVLIYGGHYSERTYPDIQAGAALAWERSLDLAQKAQVKEMVLFHHNPVHDDDYLDHIEMEMHNCCADLRLAREGMVLQLPIAPAS
jgi:ribonuclease Z